MKLPNLSYLTKVGQLRYIQSIYEIPECRNPDILVREFLPLLQRWGGFWRGWLQLNNLRSHPFYYYILARTKYYDEVFIDAIYDRVSAVINIGCGSDTRSHRFNYLLRQKGVKILECDQSEAIHTKQQIARKKWPNHHIEYCSIDINDDNSWSDLNHWLSENHGAKIQVMMEGVAPYVNEEAFGRFLAFLAYKLQPGSRIAYDFKFLGVWDDLGRSHRIQTPFRLPNVREKILDYHESLGYEIESLELSSDLLVRLLPNLGISSAPVFKQDSLIRLLVPNPDKPETKK